MSAVFVNLKISRLNLLRLVDWSCLGFINNLIENVSIEQGLFIAKL